MTTLFDAQEAADYLRCSQQQISDLIREGKLRGAKIGRGWVFKVEWLEDLLEEEANRQMGRIMEDSGPPKRKQKAGHRYPDLSRYESPEMRR